MPVTKKLKIDVLLRDHGTQTRESLDSDAVERYAEAMKSGTKLPPPVVFFDGTNYRIADGFHRVEAAAKNGRTQIDCVIQNGSRVDAIVRGSAENQKHGKNGRALSNKDKRHCVIVLLDALREAGERWTNRRVGEVCGVRHETVAAVLRASGEIRQSGPAVDRRGRVHKPREPRPKPATPEAAKAVVPPMAEVIEDAPNQFVGLQTAIATATTRPQLEEIYSRLSQACEAGSIVPTEAGQLVTAWTSRKASVDPPVAAAPTAPVTEEDEEEDGDDEGEIVTTSVLPFSTFSEASAVSFVELVLRQIHELTPGGARLAWLISTLKSWLNRFEEKQKEVA